MYFFTHITRECSKLQKLLNSPATYHEYQHKAILESPDVIQYCNRPITTDKTLYYIRHDFLVIGKKQKKTAYLTSIGILLTTNIKKAETEKVNK